MSIEFAERIIDSMVDENGHCGERGLSKKQFEALARYLTACESKQQGGWSGSTGGHVAFYSTDFVGTIGKYRVELNVYSHFNNRYTVKSIDKWIDEVPTFEHSAHKYETKQRIDLVLTLVSVYEFMRERYTYGYEPFYIYKLSDAEGNCYVWKTTSLISKETEDEDGGIDYVFAREGDTVKLRGTVKENGEYKGVKQTVLTRCKVNEVAKR